MHQAIWTHVETSCPNNFSACIGHSILSPYPVTMYTLLVHPLCQHSSVTDRPGLSPLFFSQKRSKMKSNLPINQRCGEMGNVTCLLGGLGGGGQSWESRSACTLTSVLGGPHHFRWKAQDCQPRDHLHITLCGRVSDLNSGKASHPAWQWLLWITGVSPFQMLGLWRGASLFWPIYRSDTVIFLP